MSDLISRQDAIDQLHQSYNLLDAEARIEDLPSAERKGKWELAEDGWYCTSCEIYPPFDCDPEEKGIPYCPNCGARMVSE